MDAELLRRLAKQLSDPQHVYIRFKKRYMCHGSDGAAYDGKPIRFTRMAAERLLKEWEFQGAAMVPA